MDCKEFLLKLFRFCSCSSECNNKEKKESRKKKEERERKLMQEVLERLRFLEQHQIKK